VSYLTELDQLARALGFELIRTQRHQIWRHPSGAQVSTASTPRDRDGALRSAARDFRRALSQQEVA
jgi:hypothetical protein